MLILDTKEVTKRFGGLTAVNQVSMQVEDGQIYGLIGPNGAGKSTFINSVVGRFAPTEGTVYFNGEETTGLSAEAMCHKGMARTFQIPRPFPQLTVLENVKVGVIFGSVDKDPMPADGPCVFTGKAAIYYGDNDYFDDKAGHVLLKNQPLAICDKTAGQLKALKRNDIYFSESTYHYDGGGCC